MARDNPPPCVILKDTPVFDQTAHFHSIIFFHAMACCEERQFNFYPFHIHPLPSVSDLNDTRRDVFPLISRFCLPPLL
jgi:hypothetical protein